MKRKMYSFFTLLLAMLATACIFVGYQKEASGAKATVV